MLALSLVPLVWSVVLPGSDQLRADQVQVVVSPTGAVSSAHMRSSAAETSARSGWTDTANTADSTQYTQWDFQYQGCLYNTSMDSVSAKQTSSKAVFDAYSCMNYCSPTRIGDGDRIGLSGMKECYCLAADWLPPADSGEFGVPAVQSAGDWASLSSSSDGCASCSPQTQSGCMLQTVQLPCDNDCGNECSCEECHEDENTGKSFDDYCDDSCGADGAKKCGSPEGTDAQGQPTANYVAIYLVGHTVATIVTPAPTPEPCVLQESSCHKEETTTTTT